MVQMLFPVGNKVLETQLPSFLHVALERAGPGGRKGLLSREVGQRLPWGEEFCCGRRGVGLVSQWREYPTLLRQPGERAILKAKALCGGGSTGRLVKPGELHITLSSAAQSRSGAQQRPLSTLPHLHLGGKTGKPRRQRHLRCLPISPTSLIS